MALSCDEDTYHIIRSHAQNLVRFINEYKWISEAYIVEFFVRDHWQNIPRSWQDVFQDFGTEEMASLLSGQPMMSGGKMHYHKVWPLSLLAYQAAALSLALPRMLRAEDDNVDEVEHILKKTKTSFEPLPHHYRRHVKPKKQYEIFRLARLVNRACAESCCQNLVDVGAGLGHLTRLLSFGYGLHVTTVEADGCNVSGAVKLDSKLKEFIEVKSVENPTKLKGVQQPGSASNHQLVPSHVIFRIAADIGVDDFLDLLHENREAVLTAAAGGDVSSVVEGAKQNGSAAPVDKSTAHATSESAANAQHDEVQKSVTGDSKSFVFAGLHTCGDLAPTILRVFTRCKSATALVSVGCCYQKMTCQNAIPARRPCHFANGNCETTNERETVSVLDTGNPRTSVGDKNFDQPLGYPMSSWVNDLPNHELNYEPRELACHAVDVYIQRLRDGDPDLILQCYRAILETVIQKQAPELIKKHASIRNVKRVMKNLKKRSDTPLNQYLSEALSKLGLEQISEAESVELEKLLTRWKQLVIFHIIRLLTAPVIESLILIDRMLYLYEQDCESQLIPVFNPQVSPRNFALLSKKSPPH